MDEQQEWLEVREQLTPSDTEMNLSQLNVMNSVEVVYDDGTRSEWSQDLQEKYENLLEAFGGEEQVNQYHDIGAFGVTIAVEQDEKPLFVVYGEESTYSRAGIAGRLTSTI